MTVPSLLWVCTHTHTHTQSIYVILSNVTRDVTPFTHKWSSQLPSNMRYTNLTQDVHVQLCVDLTTFHQLH